MTQPSRRRRNTSSLTDFIPSSNTSAPKPAPAESRRPPMPPAAHRDECTLQALQVLSQGDDGPNIPTRDYPRDVERRHEYSPADKEHPYAPESAYAPRHQEEDDYSKPRFPQDSYRESQPDPEESSVQRGGFFSRYKWSKLVPEVLILIVVASVVAGVLAFVLDKYLAVQFSDTYTPAELKQHISSGVLVLATGVVAFLVFILLDSVTDKSRGAFAALLWVILLAFVAWVVLESLSVAAIGYAAPAFVGLVSFSYIPAFVHDNTYEED